MNDREMNHVELNHGELDHKELEQRILALIRQMLGSQEIGLDTVLLGKAGVLDSVTTVELIVKLEQEFQIEFDEDDLWIESLESPRKIIKLIAEAIW